MHSMQFVNRSNGLKCFVRFPAVFIALSGTPVLALTGSGGSVGMDPTSADAEE